jgi:hypothetical protein
VVQANRIDEITAGRVARRKELLKVALSWQLINKFDNPILSTDTVADVTDSPAM